MIVHRHIPEAPGNPYRLGRHVFHDPQSRNYPAEESAAPLHDVLWSSKGLPLNQGQVGKCFPPGTRIRMADGSERPIEDVRLGDRVVTAEGGTGRVTRMMLRDEDGGLLRLVLRGHSHLRMTREHPVLTQRGYVPAIQLRGGDEVALTRYQGDQPVTHVFVADHVEKPSHRLVRGNRWQGLPGRHGLRSGAHALPEKIALDASFGRLVGLFLAEGSCDSGKVTWAFHIDERETLAEEVAQIMAGYGVQAHRRDIPVHHGHVVVVHGTAWTRLLSSLCGNGAGLKRLHPDLTAGPPEFLAAVLSGWQDGDGCQVNATTNVGSTISHDLALNIYDIAQALGVRPVIRHVAPKVNRHAKTRQWRWEVGIGANEVNAKSKQDDRCVWRPVLSFQLEDYVGPVYNLSVESGQSYVAEGIGVHNCTAEALCGRLNSQPAETLRTYTDADSDVLYEQETAMEGAPWNPADPTVNDVGGSGLEVAKAALALGWIYSYTHAFSLSAALSGLMIRPALTGTYWYNSMFTPDSEGLVTVDQSSGIAGGHEFLVDQVITGSQQVGCWNSWGTGWGAGGRFYLSWTDWGTLLSQQGDVTFIHIT